MSRINYNEFDDPASVMGYGRWLRNSQTTISSKRGQAALKELREALLALPVKRLVKNTFCESDEEGNVNACVLGAWALHKGFNPDDPTLPNDEDADEAALWAEKNLGVANTLAWNLVDLNDEHLAKSHRKNGTCRPFNGLSNASSSKQK